jgi:hypothetical protein
MYVIEDEKTLQDRYAHLQLRDTSDLRLSYLCHSAPGHGITGAPGQAN